MRAAIVENEYALKFRHLKNLHTIRSGKLSRASRRFATRVGFHCLDAAFGGD
jgi:hypothetical protein